MSTNIPTVGVVTFTVSGASSLDSAEIHFGPDTNYGLIAPVDVTTGSSNYKTPLLGMKGGKTYHFQVVGVSGNSQCASQDYTVTTGNCPNAIKRPTITTKASDKSLLDGGFLVMEGYKATTPDDYAYILDGDGDMVWCYKPSGFSDLTAAMMSYDGKYMWLAHGNVPQATGGAHAGRVTMDGTFEDLSSQFTDLNHDIAILPDETVAFIAYSSSGCDDIKERSPSGTVKTIINSGKAFGNSNSCHCNAIQYSKDDDTLIFSDDDHSAYVKVNRSGNIKWVLNGGTYNSFDKSGGGGTGWTGNHNLHILGTDHLIIFNNGTSSSTGSAGGSSVARELTLNLTSMTSSLTWSYTANPPISNAVMGDVQRLSNGNTMIAYSLSGTIHEVDSKGTLLQQLSWGSGASVGYITKRKTLYGPPPR